MWDQIWHWLDATRRCATGMDSWDWLWFVAVVLLIGAWSLRTMPIGMSQ